MRSSEALRKHQRISHPHLRDRTEKDTNRDIPARTMVGRVMVMGEEDGRGRQSHERPTRHKAHSDGFFASPWFGEAPRLSYRLYLFLIRWRLVLGADFFSLLCWLLEARTLSLVRTVGRCRQGFVCLSSLLAFPSQMLDISLVVVAVVLGVVRVALRSSVPGGQPRDRPT